MTEDHCAECGGALYLSVGPGRTYRFRGVDYEIPATLTFQACADCGEEWLTPDNIDALDAVIEAERARRMAASPEGKAS